MFTRGVPIIRNEPPPEKELPQEYSSMIRNMVGSGSGKFSTDSGLEYINDGKDFFERLLHDIRYARKNICIECYLIRSDEFSRNFVKLLMKKAEEGVNVRIVFDDFGYDGKDFTYVRMLRKAGAECGIFHNMTKMMFSPLKNYRNHRKITVVDGNIGYVGGFNIGEEYMGNGKFGKWNDSAVRVTGPQCQELLGSFSEIWKYVTRKDISADTTLFTDVPDEGDVPMMSVPGNPITAKDNPIRAQMTQMFSNAKERILIETPYFNLPRDLIKILKDKCRNGVDVRVIIPADEDHPTVFWCNRWNAYQLIKAGGKVYEYANGFIHGKVSVCDKYCSVGTANYDIRSITLNFECNVVVFSEKITEKVSDSFQKALRDCREYTAEMFRNRTVGQRIRTLLSMLFVSQI